MTTILTAPNRPHTCYLPAGLAPRVEADAPVKLETGHSIRRCGRFTVALDRSARACGDREFGFWLGDHFVCWARPLCANPERYAALTAERDALAERIMAEHQAFIATWNAWRAAGSQGPEPTEDADAPHLARYNTLQSELLHGVGSQVEAALERLRESWKLAAELNETPAELPSHLQRLTALERDMLRLYDLPPAWWRANS